MLLCNVVIMKEIQIKRVTLNCLNCFEGGGGCCVVTCPRQLTQIESASVPQTVVIQVVNWLQIIENDLAVATQQSHLTTTNWNMGWKLLISYFWKSKENVSGSDRSTLFDILNPVSDGDHEKLDKCCDDLNFSMSSKKYGPGSPAFRRKGLLRRQG